MYAYQVKEEIFGSALSAGWSRFPRLRHKTLAHTVACHQHVRSREPATLDFSRGLADGDYRTSNIILKIDKDDEKQPDQPIISRAK